MALLVLFGFVAGAATALSPCVLPVLPVALSAGLTGGRRRPLGVATGLWLSFTFATIALVYVISALGLPDDLLRTIAVVTLIGFGVALAVPFAAAWIEGRLSRLTPSGAVRRGGDGFWSGVVAGLGLGLVYAPCAGPILAGVITASASQDFSAGRLAVAIAYGLGSAVVLYALLAGGRRLTAPLARRGGNFQMAMGAVMALVGVAMLLQWDIRFETAIAKHLPAAVVNPSRSIETSSSARGRLAELRGRGGASEAGSAQARRGAKLPRLGQAPDFTGNQRWWGTPGGRPLTLAGLGGRVVLVDFWTYSCINCLRTLPYLTAWDRRYRRDGLTIVGVHTPEFPFERSAGNVAAAIRQNGIRYPVAQDNEYATWNAYGNRYWPAEYLIDAAGQVRLVHFGEGEYAAKERAIRALLAEAGARRLGGMTRTRGEAPDAGVQTPETYLGAARAERFANGPIRAGERTYAMPAAPLPPSHLAYGGAWRIGPEDARAVRGGRLRLDFTARRVFLVLGSPGRARAVRVALDGHPLPPALAGADVRGGVARVRAQRLYRLVELPRAGRHVLDLRLAPGVTGYAFTFG